MFPIFIGWIIGDVSHRIGLSRAIAVALLLGGLAYVADRLVAVNVDPRLGPYAAAVAPLTLFGWAMWSPASHRLSLWISDGVYLAARLTMWVMLIGIAGTLIGARFNLHVWVVRSSPLAITAAVLWGVQRVIFMHSLRSHQRLGERSVAKLEA